MIESIKKTLEKQKKEDGGKFGVHVNIFGSKGSGKTYSAIKVAKSCFKAPLVYRMSDDFDNEDVVLFPPRNYIDDLDPFIHKVKHLAKHGVIDAVIFDEADMLFPSNKPLTPIQKELVDKHRHFPCSVVFISRRPQNLNSMIAEEGHFTSVYAIEGDNVIMKLNRINKEFGDMVQSLEYKDYRCVLKELGKPPIIKEPIQ